MLSLVRNKTIDALEYTLTVIEQYDKGYEKLSVIRNEKSNEKEESKNDAKPVSRLDDVKTRYFQYVVLNKNRLVRIITILQDFFTCENVCNYCTKTKEQLALVTENKVYIKIDEFLHLNDLIANSLKLSNQVYSSLKTEIVIPIAKSVVLVYDVSLKKISLVFQTAKNHFLVQYIAEKLNASRITLASNWMRLDFDSDGKVTISDLIETIRRLHSMMLETWIVSKAKAIKETVYKALSFLDCSVEVKNDVKNFLVLKSDEDDNTCDSIELKNLTDKDE